MYDETSILDHVNMQVSQGVGAASVSWAPKAQLPAAAPHVLPPSELTSLSLLMFEESDLVTKSSEPSLDSAIAEPA